MLEEYQDEFLDDLGDLPKAAPQQPATRSAYAAGGRDVRRPNPQMREFTPKRGYQYQAYEKPEPFYDEPSANSLPPMRGGRPQRNNDPELAAVLSGAGPGLGFVKTMLMGALSILIVVGSFYTSFTLGKKIFAPGHEVVRNNTENFENAPLSPNTSAEELANLDPNTLKVETPKPVVKTESQKHLTPIYEYDEAQRIKSQMGHVGQTPVKKPVVVVQKAPVVKKTQPVVVAKTPVKKPVTVVTTVANDSKLHRVIAGSFSKLESAKAEAEKLKSAGFQATVYRNADNLYRVQIGVYRDLQNAQGALDRAIEYGYPAYISQN